MAKLREYDFVLEVEGVELTDAVVAALHRAGCDDATIGMHEGRLTLAFTRRAPNIHAAFRDAKRDVGNAEIGGRIVNCKKITID